jgi:TrpR-related protein YerC/YecD
MSYPTKQDKELIKALSSLQNEKEMTAFLRDLMTPMEIEEFSRRFQIAKHLWTTTQSYLEIAAKVDTSSTTVTRVAQWLFKENWGGYRTVLKRIFGVSKR